MRTVTRAYTTLIFSYLDFFPHQGIDAIHVMRAVGGQQI